MHIEHFFDEKQIGVLHRHINCPEELSFPISKNEVFLILGSEGEVVFQIFEVDAKWYRELVTNDL